MSVTLTPERLAAVYDMLRAFPPFSRWGLPPSDEVKFRVLRTPRLFGLYQPYTDGTHEIQISAGANGHLDTLASTMAHEMIHLYQRIKKNYRGDTHNREFHRIAKQVCARFGWDPKTFV